MHGPRESGMFGRKARRKTVTFDERCDVMEFSREEDLDVDENQTDWTTDDDEEDDARMDDQEQHAPDREGNESFDSQQGGDDSITGLVDSMLQDNEPHTPTRDQGFPGDLELEDGVPYGRTHHAERAAAVHSMQRPDFDDVAEGEVVNVQHSGLSTPPHSRDTPPIGVLSHGSHIPLGRSTHSERQRVHKEQDNAGVDEDIQMLPPSPSPAKRTGILPVVHSNRDSLIPRFDLGIPKEDKSGLSDSMPHIDPFGPSPIKDELPPEERSFMSAQLIDRTRDDDDNDLANLSVGQSEVSLSGIDEAHIPQAASTPPTSPPLRNTLGRLKTSSVQSFDKLIDLDSPPPAAATQSAFEGLGVDFSSSFDVGDLEPTSRNGLGMSFGETPLGDMKSALDRLMADVAGEASMGPGEQSGMRVKIEAVTTGIQAGQYQVPSHTVDPDETHEQSREVDIEMADALTAEPGPPGETAIQRHDRLFKEKKREAKQRESDEIMGLRTPERKLGIGRPGRRRSRSTGDAEPATHRNGGRKRPSSSHGPAGMLNDILDEDGEDPLADSIDRELRKMGTPSQQTYHIRERSETIYASSDADRGTHNGSGGSDDKAWRAVRRPSDMNEYSKQLKALQAAQGKAHGKVFVKVLGVRNLIVPLPQQPTAVSCTLNNGIHFVTTPECTLKHECRIEQEFELLETSKLEITLTLKVRRDPHIIAQFKANAPPRPSAPPVISQPQPPPASKGGGMRNFFMGSPKKPHKVAPTPRATPPPPPPVHRLQENLARYLTSDGSLARAFIQFKDIARHCDTRLFETAFPLIGQKQEAGGVIKSMQVGELVLQMFRLPPLPGIPPDDLPQSLDECHRGLKQIDWHKRTYTEGTLTQSGGDCVSWRRRRLRVIGSNLVAFNDVTKKMTATIDLKKAIGVVDDELSRNSLLSPASGLSARYSDDYESPFGVERSFRLLFPNNEEILFFADSDPEKTEWLRVLTAIVGSVPSKPLWAEVLWQRQQEEHANSRQAAGSSTPRTPAS
ncbi:hypothetical protein EUX98_g3308 [Antrodiella citrinella]|uniref:PH domain-containing protein n=1 Tax=Antrodiella citrinella TaxID=2447956 RepID=A0A4S4MZB0_9APHY|nr:hypothetical protein EUX98_g3308 [Antrodiella citrinella]